MNIFEQASRQALRFPSVKGELTVENLWELPLSSKNNFDFDLDAIAKLVNTQLKSIAEDSFVSVSSNPLQPLLQLKLDILKHIIAAKLEQNAQARSAQVRASERDKLLSVLAKKQDAALESLSPEEIQARLAALS